VSAPSYLGLERAELLERARRAVASLASCSLCPRGCGADRLGGRLGVCRIGAQARVASAAPHFGEERPLVGPGGSGTIFFSGCGLLCSFCQNYDISHGLAGVDVSAASLARIMLGLQAAGCSNINLVTPTHVAPRILEALPLAIDGGLRLPLVWNCGGYESVETLRLLDGIVDIYMPDFKFWENEGEGWLRGARSYGRVAQEALREMHRQVGDLLVEGGLAVRGLLVRHLVMPRGAADTAAIMGFLASLSRDTYVNVMAQYRPVYGARGDARIGARVTPAEYDAAVAAARAAGLHRLDG
jgi:putative pyruvate formate lyase activating enzyme